MSTASRKLTRISLDELRLLRSGGVTSFGTSERLSLGCCPSRPEAHVAPCDEPPARGGVGHNSPDLVPVPLEDSQVALKDYSRLPLQDVVRHPSG